MSPQAGSRHSAAAERPLYDKLTAASVAADKKLYQRQIEATNGEIDALVYELYGLTGEEMAIVGTGSLTRPDPPLQTIRPGAEMSA